mmetsp:Transcript_75092/g.119292  ORF Transcript_75092/g.119292 Transcript_75092/m.119292 type:complete len:196 (+) Transcript_75092:3-590(+)
MEIDPAEEKLQAIQQACGARLTEETENVLVQYSSPVNLVVSNARRDLRTFLSSIVMHEVSLVPPELTGLKGTTLMDIFCEGDVDFSERQLRLGASRGRQAERKVQRPGPVLVELGKPGRQRQQRARQWHEAVRAVSQLVKVEIRTGHAVCQSLEEFQAIQQACAARLTQDAENVLTHGYSSHVNLVLCLPGFWRD